MLPASSKGGGQAFAFPDVCKTPAPPAPAPVPMPYPNTGMLMQASKESTKVKFSGKGAATKKTEIPRSMGDEPGVAGGLVSGTNMHKVQFKAGSTTVTVEGQPVQYLSVMTGHNGTNANMPAGTQVAPSQTKVLVGM